MGVSGGDDSRGVGNGGGTVMARRKHTADYFPYAVKDGKTLFVLESQWQATGTGVFTNVLRFLCSTPDHHYCIKDAGDRLYFFSRLHIDEETGMKMLCAMKKTGKLDEVLFNHQIIYCQDLVDSIQDAYRKRENEIVTRERVFEFYGIPAEEREITAEESDNPQDEGGISTQKKRKEKKQKETILLSDHKFTNIPEGLSAKWREVAPGVNIPDEIKKAELWLLAHPEKRRSKWTAFLSNWMVRAQENFVKYGGNGRGRATTDFRDEKRTPLRDQIEAEVDAITARRLARQSAGDNPGRDAISDDVPDIGMLRGGPQG